MSISVKDLTESDYQLLEYINRFPSVHKTNIEKHFKGKIDSLDYRLSVLSQIDYKTSHGVPIPIQNSAYIDEEFDQTTDEYIEPYKSLNIFHITDLGKTALQEHLHSLKSQRKELFLKSVFIPIAVSFATTCISLYIVPMLPQIIKSVIDILKRFFSSFSA